MMVRRLRSSPADEKTQGSSSSVSTSIENSKKKPQEIVHAPSAIPSSVDVEKLDTNQARAIQQMQEANDAQNAGNEFPPFIPSCLFLLVCLLSEICRDLLDLELLAVGETFCWCGLPRRVFITFCMSFSVFGLLGFFVFGLLGLSASLTLPLSFSPLSHAPVGPPQR